nr:immunoglobulin heavy chain junction region [Mus musculus]
CARDSSGYVAWFAYW